MKHDWTNMLSEYLDDGLSGEQRAALEDQLRQDEALRGTLEELRTVKNLAAGLPCVEPGSDLWPGIASRLDVDAEAGLAVVADPAVVPLRPRAVASRFAFTVPQLAAAAIALVLLGGSLAYVAQLGSAGAGLDVGLVTGPGGEPGASGAGPIGTPVFTGAAAKYETAIRELEDGLAAGRDILDPETIGVIEASLGKIDVAIQEARTALEADPASEYLSRHLTGAMTRKLDVLLRANELVRAQT